MIRGNSAGQPGNARRGRPGWSGGGRKRVEQGPWGQDNAAGQDAQTNAIPAQPPTGHRQEPPSHVIGAVQSVQGGRKMARGVPFDVVNHGFLQR